VGPLHDALPFLPPFLPWAKLFFFHDVTRFCFLPNTLSLLRVRFFPQVFGGFFWSPPFFCSLSPFPASPPMDVSNLSPFLARFLTILFFPPNSFVPLTRAPPDPPLKSHDRFCFSFPLSVSNVTTLAKYVLLIVFAY